MVRREPRAVQWPRRVLRRASRPPLPMTATQYVLPAFTAVGLTRTRFQAPAVGLLIDPVARREPGLPSRFE